MESTQNISNFIAFTAGLLSFVSPCVLPLVPSYLSYITGLSLEELTAEDQAQARWITIRNSLLFISGFSAVFVAFGASATMAGQFLLTYQSVLRRIGGALVIMFGLYIAGVLKLPFLAMERRHQFQQRPTGMIGPVLVGVAFAAGWTPCVGPILGSILLYASTAGSVYNGIWLLSFYSMGLGLPLFLAALGVNTFLLSFKRLKNYLWAVSLISGLFLVFVGLLLITNSLTIFSAWLTQRGIGWNLGQ